jgi:hypothetical protein
MPPSPPPSDPKEHRQRRSGRGKAGSIWSSLFGGALSLEKRVVVAGGALFGLAAAITAFIANVDTLQSRFEKWNRDRHYVNALRRPYPNLLTENDIKTWSSGRMKLALHQIDGYLGRERSAPSWLKSCLTSPSVFKSDYQTQFNERLELDESYIDKENKELLQRRIDTYDVLKTEDAEIFGIPDPFDRLLKRSSVQLLADYKDTEIASLDKAELYLLRNAIYGQYGFVFDTPKLRKLANRRGWSAKSPSFTMDRLSEVEKCNAFFLQQVYPQKELGALGRGVMIRPTGSSSLLPLLKPMLCTCLGGRKSAIDCHDGHLDSASEFREHVDLLLDLETGDSVRVDWTFLDPRYVVPPDVDDFKANQFRFMAAAVDFSASLYKTFRPHNLSVAGSQDINLGSYWGAKLTLSPDAVQQLASDPSFLHDTATAMCTGIRGALDQIGPYIPRTVDLVSVKPDPSQPALAIYDKPIVFDDLRTKLTQDYITQHYAIAGPGTELIPAMIVVNWTDTADIDAAYEKYRPSVLPGSQGPATPEGIVNPSVHYLVDRDGTLFSLMKDVIVARQIVGLDRHALAIAAVGTASAPPTPAQAQTTAQLVRYLVKKFGKIEFLIGESEYQPFVGTPWWEEKNPQLKPTEAGPGKEFLDDLRSRIPDLKLRSAP